MTVSEEKNSSRQVQPFEALETPFLSEEFLNKQTEDKLQGHLNLLEFETPFLGEFEKIGTHPEAAELESPEAYMNEFEQENESPTAQWLLEPVSEDEQTLTGGDYQERPAPVLLEQHLNESFLPIELPNRFLAVADALSKKDWPLAVQLAIQAGQYEEQQLTNLIFFAKHPELPPKKLDKNNPQFRQLSSDWIDILKKIVKPALERAFENDDLKVSGAYVVERDQQFMGESGKKFKDLVTWAAGEVNLNPGFLAAVLLAEWDKNSLYLSSGAVYSFRSGTDDFFAMANDLRANVPAFSKVGFDEKKKTTNINEHGRVVTTIPFNSGKDAALATAVYLKYGEIKLRTAATKNGGDFDKLPIETQFALVRIAMAAGHSGLGRDGDLIRFKRQNDRWVPVKKGEKGGILLGVASSLEKVLKGEDILIRKNEPRRDPTNSEHVTLRNATILAAQAMHLSDLIFGIPTAARTQPELETFEEEQTHLFAAESVQVQTEQHEAAMLYDEEYEDSKLPQNLTADAFVSDEDGKEYFTMFSQLGDLTIKKVSVLTPSNFESLMDHMLASNQKNFAIDAHGNPSGLSMHLASSTKIPATKQSLFILRGIQYIRTLMQVAQENNTIWERASEADIERWQRIVKILHSKTWQRMIGSSWPTTMPQVSDVKVAKSIIQSRIGSLVDWLFPGVGNRQERVDSLVKKMLQLQAKGIREIQFRACNIGKDVITLYEFRKFFGADYVCAPDVRSGMGYVVPQIDRSSVDRLAKKGETQVYTLSSGRFALYIHIAGTSFTSHAAADTQEAVREWVAGHTMANSKYRSGKLPIHFLQTQPPVFALDKDYAVHIQCRSSFWEGALRANELEEQEAHQIEGNEPYTSIAREEEESAAEELSDNGLKQGTESLLAD